MLALLPGAFPAQVMHVSEAKSEQSWASPLNAQMQLVHTYFP